MRKPISIFLLLAFFSQANAAGWSGFTKITQLYANSSQNGGSIYVYVEDLANSDSCTNGDYFTLLKSNSMAQEIVSILLTSSMAGKEVNFYLSGCDDATQNPKIKHVRMVAQ